MFIIKEKRLPVFQKSFLPVDPSRCAFSKRGSPTWASLTKLRLSGQLLAQLVEKNKKGDPFVSPFHFLFLISHNLPRTH